MLEGSDDRFGIDTTDPNYKETEGMKEILKVQRDNRRRKNKNKRGRDDLESKRGREIDGMEEEGDKEEEGINELVKRLKKKIHKVQ